jgi:hypothetical protein
MQKLNETLQWAGTACLLVMYVLMSFYPHLHPWEHRCRDLRRSMLPSVDYPCGKQATDDSEWCGISHWSSRVIPCMGLTVR